MPIEILLSLQKILRKYREFLNFVILNATPNDYLSTQKTELEVVMQWVEDEINKQ